MISYFLFKLLNTKFKVETPGRETDIEKEDEIKLYSKKDYNEKIENKNSRKRKRQEKNAQGLELAEKIITALGGRENILDVDNCISRLRVVVKDSDLVADDNVWKNQLEAMGVVRFEGAVQVIYGAHVAGVAGDVRHVLGS